MVLLEAMRAGRPTIATKVEGSGMNWVVDHEGTGLLVEPESKEALAAGIMRMRDSPKMLESMGSAGRRRFLSHFQMKDLTARLTALYQTIAGSR